MHRHNAVQQNMLRHIWDMGHEDLSCMSIQSRPIRIIFSKYIHGKWPSKHSMKLSAGHISPRELTYVLIESVLKAGQPDPHANAARHDKGV